MKKKEKRISLIIIFLILISMILIILYKISSLPTGTIEKKKIDILEMQEDEEKIDIMEVNIAEKILDSSKIKNSENNIIMDDKSKEVENTSTVNNTKKENVELIKEIKPHIDSATNVKYITYEDIGIAKKEEDGYNIIKETHEIANKNGYEVRATLQEYHIYRVNDIEPICIQTNTNWNGANFIIHDEEIKDYQSKKYEIFQIASAQKDIIITDEKLLGKIILNTHTKKIEQIKGYGNCLCVVYNSNKKQFIRSGNNQNDGEIQVDIFKIDNEGNLLNDIKWNFEEITMIRLIPIPEEQIVIQNGNFQTKLDVNQNEQEKEYWNRNIRCLRSNTILKNINHSLDNENNLGGPYYGFLRISYATEVTLQECKLVAHKYEKTSNYDLILEYATNIELDKVICDNIEDDNRWGITGTNYTKDVTYKNCVLNRIDSHCGVHNLTIDSCVVGVKGIILNGTGNLKIFNSTKIGGNSFIELRADYGSTWNGNIQIQDCKYYNKDKSKRLINLKTNYTKEGTLHNYGYELVLPNIYINHLTIEDNDTRDELTYIFYNDKYAVGNEEGNLIKAGYTLPKEICIDHYETSCEKAIKAFYQDFEELSNVKIQIDIPNRPRLQMKTENNIEHINGELTNQNISLKLETKDKIQNEIQINGQAIEEKETTLKETGNYHIIVTSIDSAGNTIQDQYEVKIDKKPPTITGIEQNKIYEKNVTPKVEDENLQSVTLHYNGKIMEDYKINTQLTKEGKYQIEAMDKAGNKTNISFEIQYPDKIENITQYKVKEKYILGISPTTTKQQFLKNATLNMKLKIYHENKEIGENEILKTGDKIQINNQSYTLIVKGDLSGDGKTNITDIMQVKRHIISKTEITKEKTMAGDINSDGKIDIKDVMLMIRMTIST